ncbi:MAG TPA: DUF5985 family protein [Phycisphaerales bacterium]|nr:DUF5985 family protein [Phycisphaerales bacterium]
MAETVYILCAVTSLLCTALLLRGYRRSRARLLLWSSLCFVGLAINNIMLFVDMVLLPERDLSHWRSVPALIGFLVLTYGLVIDGE